MKLKIENLSKRFGENEVFKDTSIEFKNGHIYGIIGRNGSGKSTLFKLIARELKKDRGDIYLDEKEIENSDTSIIYDKPILPNFMTGYEYLYFINDIHGEKERSFEKYFKDFELKREELDDLIKNYSLGMKAKIQIIASLIIKPKVLLLDEPLTSLDMVVGKRIREILLGLSKDHIILLSTHVMDIAKNLCDKITVINHKKLEHKNINSESFEEEIIEVLKDE